MKKINLLLTALVLLCAACRSYDCRLLSRDLSGVEGRELSNRYVSFEVAPKASGALVGINYLPLQKQLCTPFSYKVQTDDLIPDRVETSRGGARILLWGEKNLKSQEMFISREDSSARQCVLELYNPFYQGKELSLTRSFSISKNQAALQVTLLAENKSKRSIDFTLWENMVVQLDAQSADTIILPGRGNVERIGRKGMQRLKQDAIFLDDDSVFDKEVCVAPARNWIARRNPASSLILALRSNYEDIYPNGFFYTWQQQAGSPLHTMELIFNPQSLEPGESKQYRLDYLFFHGLPGLHEICGDVGLYATVEKQELAVLLNCINVGQLKSLKLVLSDSQGQELQLDERLINFDEPTKTKREAYSLAGLPPGSYRLRGSLDHEEFELLPEIIVP